MASPGLTVFILFFGLGLLDAVRTGDVARALFWIGMGIVFGLLDRVQLPKRD